MQIGSATEAFSNRVIFAQNVSMPIIAYLTCHSRYVQQMLHGNRTKKGGIYAATVAWSLLILTENKNMEKSGKKI